MHNENAMAITLVEQMQYAAISELESLLSQVKFLKEAADEDARENPVQMSSAANAVAAILRLIEAQIESLKKMDVDDMAERSVAMAREMRGDDD